MPEDTRVATERRHLDDVLTVRRSNEDDLAQKARAGVIIALEAFGGAWITGTTILVVNGEGRIEVRITSGYHGGSQKNEKRELKT